MESAQGKYNDDDDSYSFFPKYSAEYSVVLVVCEKIFILFNNFFSQYRLKILIKFVIQRQQTQQQQQQQM